MAGHNKWSSIKHKKGNLDAKRGKIFSKISKEIITAVQLGGTDQNINIRLRAVIQDAKTHNMPNENISRAIKKGAGELQSSELLEDLSYEGFGPYGIAIIVHCLSNNRNRTAAELRTGFSKAGGSLAQQGSVLWMFKKYCSFLVENDGNLENIFNIALEAGADNLIELNQKVQIIGPPDMFSQILRNLEEKGFLVHSMKQQILIPKEEVSLERETQNLKILKLLESLSALDDVQEVYSNIKY